MLYTKIFRTTVFSLIAMALLVGLSACGGGGSEPLATNGQMNFQLNCVNGQSVPGTASTGCAPPTTNTGNTNQSSQILNTDNGPFVGSVTVRTVDAVAAIGTLLQSVLPALTSSASLPSCTNSGGSLTPMTDAVEFSNCALPAMPYTVNGTLSVDTANGGSTNVELTRLGGAANFQLLDSNSNALVTEIQTHDASLNAVVQLTTNPSITLSENTAITTPTIDIIKPGSPGEVYTLASGFNAVLTSDPGGGPVNLTLAGGIQNVPTTGLAVTISAVPSLTWNGSPNPTSGNITATATDGTSVTLTIDTQSDVTISVTTNGNNTGVCDPLSWSNLANGSAIATANCS